MMKKIFTILFVFSLSLSNAFAGVRHIATDSSNSDSGTHRHSGSYYQHNEEPSYEDPATTCTNAGYSRHGCPNGYRPIGECPYDSSYYAGCCRPQYQYSAQDCINAQMKPSSDTCMGYYACE